jgi:hypothetical protein
MQGCVLFSPSWVTIIECKPLLYTDNWYCMHALVRVKTHCLKQANVKATVPDVFFTLVLVL